MEGKEDKYVYFVLLNPNKAKYSFSAYDVDGMVQFLYNRVDYKSGQPLKRRFEFSKSYRTIRVPLAQRMKNQDGELVSVVEFLRAHPECAGSPNAKPHQKALFKCMDEDGDAKISLEARTLKLKAESAALALEGAQLEAISSACGYVPGESGWSDNLAIYKCLEMAGHDPAGFMKMLQDDTYEAKAFLGKAVKGGVVNIVGNKYMWGKVALGDSEDEAVATLLSDVQLMRGIKMKLSQVGVAVTVPEKD